MFILVEGLVTKGWVGIFAQGWAFWAMKSNPAVAIEGMGFVSVCMCNVRDFSLGLSYFLILFYSSQVQISVQPFCCLVCSKLGCQSTTVGSYETGDRALASAVKNLLLTPLNINLCPGAGCQLWRFQCRLQCFTSRIALERYPSTKTYYCPTTRLCTS